MKALSSFVRLAGVIALAVVVGLAPNPLSDLALVLVIAIAWAYTFASRQARTLRMAALMVALSVLCWLPVTGRVPGLPSIAEAAYGVGAVLAWLIATANGERLGLFALTAQEDQLNDALRRISLAAGIIGLEDDPVRRPADLDRLLAELEALEPSDERWARVIRLTKEYLLALPDGEPVPQRSMIEFLMWRTIWFDTHDRRIMFARRPDAVRDFEADIRCDRAAFVRALQRGDRKEAATDLGQLADRRASTASWAAAQEMLATALRLRLDAEANGRDANADADVIAAESRLGEAWPAGSRPAPGIPLGSSRLRSAL